MQTDIQTHTDRADSYIEREMQTERESQLQIETQREIYIPRDTSAEMEMENQR